MKIKSLISVFFSCALFIIFIVEIESFKDEKQFGATKEFQSEILYHYNKPWTLFPGHQKSPKKAKGVKKGEVPSGQTGSIEKDSEGGAQDEGEQNKMIND
ncbi:unnamed protein product [Lathyrus oleraceus]|uniref:Uncharacterized protein n=1 Tax=Pisum sativum TaxID=3888 RepID=A0A9D5AUW0_PEA|nr:hypothetical protein KIW84_043679 [Pisum sativum]